MKLNRLFLLVLVVSVASYGQYTIQYSLSANRANPSPLDNQIVSGNIYAFVSPVTDISQVRFYLDDPLMTGAPRQTENNPPYDFAGGSVSTASAFNTSQVNDGYHTITASITYGGGAIEVVDATFFIANLPQSLQFSQPVLNFDNQTLELTTQLTATDGGAADYVLTGVPSWATITPDSTQTPAELTVTVSTSGLQPGFYSAVVGASAPGYTPTELTLEFTLEGNYDILMSASANRSNPIPLDGQTVPDAIYVFISPETDISQVDFFLDDPLMSGAPQHTEGAAPHDFVGTAPNGTAFPFDTTQLTPGSHTVTAAVTMTSSEVEINNAEFFVTGDRSLVFSQSSLVFNNQTTQQLVTQLTASDGSATVYTLTNVPSWATITPDSTQTPAELTVTVNTGGLTEGFYSAVVNASANGYGSAALTLNLTVGPSIYELMLSTSANRTNPVPLNGQTVPSTIYVFLLPETMVGQVRFFLDDPSMSGAPQQTENGAPYDFAGSTSNGKAKPFSTSSLSSGLHNITAAITLSSGGEQIMSADFYVPGSLALQFSQSSLVFNNQTTQLTTQLSASDGSATAYTLTNVPSWATITPDSAQTPAGLTVTVDATGLSDGFYTTVVQASAAGYSPTALTLNLTVGSSTYGIQLSLAANRSSPVPLAGQTVDGNIYVFVIPETDITQVRFFLDDPVMAGTPQQVENRGPYDFAGTAPNDTALPFNTSVLTDGEHIITVAIQLTNGAIDKIDVPFTTDNGISAGTYDQVHLAWVDDPATTLTVIWRTFLLTTPSEVEYRQLGQVTWQSATGALRSSGTIGTLHEVTLNSLLPSTVYEYRVKGDSDTWSEVFQTRTAPATNSPGDFEVIYVADTGLIGRVDGLATGTAQVVDEIMQLNPLLVLLGGDYAYYNTDKRYGALDNTIDAWFNQMQPVGAWSAMMPTYGNHEILLGEGFDAWAARFATPNGFNNRRFYSFDVADVHFVSILAVSDVDGLTTAELDWIQQDIEDALQAGQRWIIPFMHVSAFGDGTNHPSNANLRAQLGPLFEQLGVQIVVASQDQAYERSYPLVDVPATNTPTSTSRICYGTSDGVVWAKVSPGGKMSNISGSFSPFGTNPAPAWTAVRDNTMHHFARLSFTADGTLYFEAFGVIGDGTPPVIVDAFAYNLTQACPEELLFDTPLVHFNLDEGENDSATVDLYTSDGSPVDFSLTENASWLSVVPDANQTPATLTVTADATGLTVGSYQTTVTASDSSYNPANLVVTLNVTSDDFNLLLSQQSSRSNPVLLAGQVVTNLIYVFVEPEAGIDHVEFYFDDPAMTGPPQQVENNGPYDFAGTLSNGKANPYDTDNISDGTHTITAAINLGAGGMEIVSEDFIVDNVADGQGLSFVPTSLQFSLDPDMVSAPSSVDLEAVNGSAVAFTITNIPAWLTVDPTSGQTPATLSVTADSTGLGAGGYVRNIQATSGIYDPASLNVSLNVLGAGGCLPLPCSEILVDLPYELDFEQDHGKILDINGTGTGFTYIDWPSNGIGYIPGNIEMTQGLLRLTTTAGIQYLDNNNQDNALGVGIDIPSQISILSTTIVNPTTGTGHYEQAGLWFGVDEDNYIKVTVQSRPTGTFVELLLEINGLVDSDIATQLTNVGSLPVTLKLTVDPQTQTITGSYKIGSGGEVMLAGYGAPPEFFSFDAAGINPEIGTRSFGGIFATNRNGTGPVVYEFEEFRVDEVPLEPIGQDLAFMRMSFTIPTPTSMVWGPDDRLYVLELFGKIHAITFDANKNVVDNESITSLQDDLGSRLALGITVDPASTPSDVILWVAHSSPSLDNGAPNSGMVTRLSGPDFSTVDHTITGLPRAIANHATNSLHFGPDGRLYIAQAGNTGAGAPNTAPSEFGQMQEQPLSAALLVADVYMAGFEGDCNNPDDIFGTPPCDVQTYSTGLRNIYDFVIHSNGQIYAPENGLGVTGTYPPVPDPPCFGFADVNTDNPGQQPDLLMRLLEGKYYGHPNPYRNECVFRDGSYQGVDPLSNYEPPMYVLGAHKSADGMIEYTSDAFCGQMQGDLLIANYSVGDDITRIKLSPDGTTVESASTLAGGFNDPLPLAQGPDGTIYVGEFGANKVTALIPQDIGCWTTVQSMPINILDPAGVAVNGKLYTVAGKTSTNYLSSLYIYDPVADSWNTGPNKPGPGLEDVIVASYNGKLYAFGGGIDPFSGAVDTATVYDPNTTTWTPLAPMPAPRMGAGAGVIGGLIYIAGGFDASGASVDTLFIYNPATDSWSSGPSMSTRRDHAGAAALGGKLYVFGGRTRNADGTAINPTLQSVEMFDPVAGTWTSRAPMPTGRRTMVVGTLNGKAQLIGGENTPLGGAFEENEEYDPVTDSWRTLMPMLTPRHGAAGSTINGTIYVAGGGVVAGTSFSNIVEAFEIAN